MKVILETILTLVEEEDLQSTVTRNTRFADKKVKDDTMSFILDTQEILGIAKSSGIEGANKAIDKVINDYTSQLKGKLSSVINS